MINDDNQLDVVQQEWLYQIYVNGREVADVAEEFGIPTAVLNRARLESASVRYIDKLVFDKRNSINLLAAGRIFTAMHDDGVKVPLETVIKIYNATLPKAAPVGFTLDISAIIKEVEAVADRYNLDTESRKTMIDFIKKREERAS